MVDQTESPVFYDPTHNRWRFYKLFITIASLALSVAFIATLYNVFTWDNLPELNIKNPTPSYRIGPLSYNPKAHFQSVIKNDSTGTGSGLQTVAGQNAGKAIKELPRSPINNSNPNYNPKVIGFYVDWDDTSFSSLKQNVSKMDELDPEWLHLQNSDGEISIDDPTRQQETLDFLNKNAPNLPIVPLINNYNSDIQDWDSKALSDMLANPDSRKRNIDEILNYIQKNSFSGVNIDYESIPKESQANYTQFVKELYSRLHPLNLEISLDIPIDNGDFNLEALSQNADYLIIMAYDEHSAEDTVGPIASQNWYSKHLVDLFKNIDHQKIIVSIGNYGYDWVSGETSNNTYSFQRAVTVARESEGKISLDPDNLNETYTYYDDNNELHQVYFLDAVTAFNQISEANHYQPSGYALWRIGSEDPSIWQVFTSRRNLKQDTVDKISQLDYGYGLNYEGDGEVLKVVSTPKTGKRESNFDDKLGLITQSKITEFPSPYIINRWGADDPQKIVLTFDDGPDPVYTPQILDILKEKKVPADFFIVGVNATQNRGLVEREYNEGHEIANHTFTHPDISTESNQAFAVELNSVQSFLESTIGRKSFLFRPPYSEDVEPENPEQVNPLVATTQLGYYTVGMHIDPKDWSRPGVDNIVNEVINQTQNKSGNVILLHDSGGDRSQTVAALPRIIDELRSRGYQFVLVSNLIGSNRDSVMPPVSGQGEVAVSKLSNLAFIVLNGFLKILGITFTVGIFLGLARFIFIALLAVIQKIRSRHDGYISSKDNQSKVSVVIPAFNEEKVIINTINSILNSDYPDFDIILVDDGSTDSTYLIAKNYFKNNPRVQIFTKPNGGKSNALNYGIAKTKAEIVITLDADTLFNKETISKLVRHFDEPKVGAVAGNAKVGNRLNLLTFWQALEYITSQNLDRRAFHMLNCITVVPGSVGAWRKEALLKARGFSNNTLAEDADLTLFIIRLGYRVVYDEEAIAYTEAPDTIRNFVKQRFRWMYGTLQTAWKHKDAVNCPGCRALGIIALPNIFIFQVFFPLISPFMDLTIITSLVWVLWQKYHHPLDYSAAFGFQKLFYFYLFFLLVDFITASIAFILERKEDRTLLLWMLLQRFFYRQLMYYVAIKVTLSVIKGRIEGWGKFERKATVTN